MFFFLHYLHIVFFDGVLVTEAFKVHGALSHERALCIVDVHSAQQLDFL